MSLLNNMLRDLEQRRGQSAGQGAPQIADLRAPPARQRAPVFLIVLVLALLLALVTVLTVTLWPEAKPSAMARQSDATIVAASDDVAAQAGDSRPENIAPAEPTPEQTRRAGASEVIRVPPVARPLPVRAQTQERESAPLPAAAQAAPSRSLATPAEPGESSVESTAATASPQPQATAAQDSPAPNPENANTTAPPARMETRVERPAPDLAAERWQAGERRQAIDILQRHLERQPTDTQARRQLADWLTALGERESAIAALQPLLAVTPVPPEVRRQLARLWQQVGDLERAIAVLEAGQGERATTDWLLLGALYQQAQRPDQAARAYRAALSAEPENGRGWAGLAIALEQMGQTETAATAWQRALAQPALPEALQRYGQQRLDALRQTPPRTDQKP